MSAILIPEKLSRSVMDGIDAAATPRDRLHTARLKLDALEHREAALREVMTENSAKAAALRREHELAELAAFEAAQALGVAEAAAALGEADANEVRLTRDELAARRKAAEKLRPRLDEATAADAAASAGYERLEALAEEIGAARAGIRAANSIIVREMADRRLAAYDVAAAEAARAMLRVHALSAFVAQMRRHDLFAAAKREIVLPPLEEGRRPALSEVEIASIAATEREALLQEMAAVGVDLAPGLGDPWTTEC